MVDHTDTRHQCPHWPDTTLLTAAPGHNYKSSTHPTDTLLSLSPIPQLAQSCSGLAPSRSQLQLSSACSGALPCRNNNISWSWHSVAIICLQIFPCFHASQHRTYFMVWKPCLWLYFKLVFTRNIGQDERRYTVTRDCSGSHVTTYWYNNIATLG